VGQTRAWGRPRPSQAPHADERVAVATREDVGGDPATAWGVIRVRG